MSIFGTVKLDYLVLVMIIELVTGNHNALIEVIQWSKWTIKSAHQHVEVEMEFKLY